MSEPKFTPGPWEWDDTVWDYDPEEQAPWLVQPNHIGLGGTVLRGQIVCSEPNARLIAAAPDLYSALEALAYRFEDHLAGKPVRDADEVLSAANLALAKVRGDV